jgi:hypothetical protein
MGLDRGQKGKVYTGARARFSVEGKVIGYARNVSGGESIEYVPVEVLDNIEVEEHVPVAYRVSLSASVLRIVGETFKSNGLFPSNGQNSADHLLNILNTGELNAQLEDTKTGKIIGQFTQVKIASYNFTVDAKGLVGNDVDFVAIRLQDESEVASATVP